MIYEACFIGQRYNMITHKLASTHKNMYFINYQDFFFGSDKRAITVYLKKSFYFFEA